MYRAVVLQVVLASSLGYIFDFDSSLPYENTDVRVIRRSKRDVTSRAMPLFYDVRLRVNGKGVTTRLDRHDETAALIGDNVDWAGYTSQDTRGIFIVQRSNLTDMTLEGYLAHGGVRYFIQPNKSAAGNHVIHKLSLYSIDNKSESAIFADWRTRRGIEMLTRPMLYFKCSFIFDGEAVTVARRRLSRVNSNMNNVNKLTQQIAIFASLYVEQAFLDLHDSVRLTFQTFNIRAHKQLTKTAEAMYKGISSDGQRQTVCAETLYKQRARKNAYYFQRDHVVYFTGLDLLTQNGGSEATALSKQGTVCSRWSVSLIEFSCNLDVIRKVAQVVMNSIGVGKDGGPSSMSIDCPASDNYIMSPNNVAPYSGPNTDVYSSCTKKWLVHSIIDLEPSNYSQCFNPRPLTLKPQRENYAGSIFTYNEQCLMATNAEARREQDLSTICSHGIRCTNGVVIMAMSGTHCAGGRGHFHYWCRGRECVAKSLLTG